MGDETIPQHDLKTCIDDIATESVRLTASIIVELPPELIVRMDYFNEAHGMTRDGFIRAVITISMDLYEGVITGKSN